MSTNQHARRMVAPLVVPCAALCALAGAAGVANAQPRNNGPDVIVGELHELANFGQSTVGGVPYSAFGVGTTSCNRGTLPVNWYDSFNESPNIPVSRWNEHPVIGQNMFRFRPVVGPSMTYNTFEQIGLSWLKHGFTALQGNACALGCTPNGNGDRLGVGCSDPYGAARNGSQGTGDMGPRSVVNPHTGVFPFPVTYAPGQTVTSVLSRRLVVRNSDLDPATNANAQYFVEGQYVTQDDAQFVNPATEPLPGLMDNDNNNASYRKITVAFSTAQNRYNASFIAGQGTVRERSAISAWPLAESGVSLNAVDVPGEGRFMYAYKVTPNADSTLFHYEVCVQNMNSDRAAGALTLNYPAGRTACIAPTNLAFHDVEYHSGEVYDGTDWVASSSASGITWACTQTYAQNVNANALRWGTMYTFRFDSPRAPVMGTGSLSLFKPGVNTGDPTSVNFAILVPSACACDIDFNNDGLFPDIADIDTLLCELSGGDCCMSATPPCDSIDVNGDGNFPDTADVDAFLTWFSTGTCS